MPIAAEMACFQQSVHNFWMRDWRRDVDYLDYALARRGAERAGLVYQPPSLLTGDPFAIPPGKGLLVLGLNPKWQGNAPAFQFHDAGPARAMWNEGRFENYCRERATYFDSDSHVYYGRYFTRLGIALAAGFFAMPEPLHDKEGHARLFLKRHVAKLDLLPWWSERTAAIDNARVRVALSPIAEWAKVIRLAADALRPRAIVVNGSTWRRLVSEVFGTKLTNIKVSCANATSSSGYQGRYGDIPVLVHAQLNSPKGTGHDGYRALAGALSAG